MTMLSMRWCLCNVSEREAIAIGIGIVRHHLVLHEESIGLSWEKIFIVKISTYPYETRDL